MHDISQLELLAPAGSPQALRAAVTAGADAVYLGLEQFNARRGAQNFTMPLFKQAAAYAHLRGVRAYVTLNTLILPHEVKAVMECARQAWRAGADAFIVQDIGLATELKRTLPQARLHISTQMNTHNAAGIAGAVALGASRVTLAREMSLEEITRLVALADTADMEVEAFAHGALCVCYSGQCLMSSLIGGRSANRGTCAQACRLPYELHNRAIRKPLPSPGEHLLSPQDLCTIDILPQLIATGVKSLKIEGRMKSPEYVAAVVGVYRGAIDRFKAACAAAGITDASQAPSVPYRVTNAEHQTLSEAFSRGFTTAYLEDQRGNEIMSYQRPNNRGVFMGRVVKATENSMILQPEDNLLYGDVIEVWTGKGRATIIVGDVTMDKKGGYKLPVDRANRDQRAIREGDRVFRVRSAAAAFHDDEMEPRILVNGKVELRLGQPARISFWPAERHMERLAPAARAAYEQKLTTFDDEGNPLPADIPAYAPCGQAEGNVVEAARTKAITAQEVREHVDRLGQTPFAILRLDICLDPGVGLGFSALHHLRADALEDLLAQMAQPWTGRMLERTNPQDDAWPIPNRPCIVAAWATNPSCARAAKRAGADVIYVPALNFKRGESVIAGQRSSTADTAGYPKAAVIALPVVNHDFEGSTREVERDIDVWEYVEPGKPVFAENWGAILRALNDGANVEVGPHVPVTNNLTLQTLADMGVERIWLSPELTLAQIKDMTQEGSPVALGITIIGTQELMTTEHCLLMSQGPCDEDCAHCARRKSPHYLKDRKDFEFPIITDALGRSHLYNSVQFDVAHTLPDLLAAGITAVMVDTTLMNSEEAAQAVGRAVRARDIARKGDNTVAKVNAATSGHLFRGVS